MLCVPCFSFLSPLLSNRAWLGCRLRSFVVLEIQRKHSPHRKECCGGLRHWGCSDKWTHFLQHPLQERNEGCDIYSNTQQPGHANPLCAEPMIACFEATHVSPSPYSSLERSVFMNKAADREWAESGNGQLSSGPDGWGFTDTVPYFSTPDSRAWSLYWSRYQAEMVLLEMSHSMGPGRWLSG